MSASFSLSLRACLTMLGVTAAVLNTPLASQVCVELLAEKTTTVGKVCVTERGDSLFVRFEASDRWRLIETHLAVARTLDGIPRAAGRHPILGQFPFKGDHAPGVAEFVYGIPIASLAGGSGDDLVIAAHASVVGDGGEEGAWAQGTPFAPEGNPATYFVYRRAGNEDADLP